MLTLNIRGLGLNASNVPVEIFDFASGVTDTADGVNIQIDEASEQAAKDILTRALDGQFQMNRIGTGILLFEPAPDPNQAEAAPQTIDTPEVETEGDGIDEEDVDDEGDEDLDEVDDTEAEEAEEDGVVSGFDLNSLERIDGDTPDERVAAINTMVASMTGTETANRAALIRQKNDRFNRDMATLISLKREIDDLTAEVAADPLVATLIEQSEYLINSDNLVNDVFFSGDSVVVVTEELVTSEPIDGAIRKIGRMAFIIKVKGFVGNPTDSYLVEIRNLDRRIGEWECGHVRGSGYPCFGTAWEGLFQAFVSRDLPTVAEVLIRFVTQPNMADSWGRVMRSWPTVEES